MGIRGTDPVVEQVRNATDILALISGYVELRKAGRRWKGLCPFHAEKTPSFFVNQENQSYFCFGCQQGGDVFQFLMEQEKLTFPEALRELADKAGIELPRRRWSGEEGVDDRLGEALEVAATFYRERLRAPEGKGARDYLTGRGIGESAIERFGLGWAPASWDALLRHARRLLPERVLLKAGLVVEGDRGLYDRFRERVVIPIRTAGGRTIAFGGRLLGPGEPKYLNSPETPLYKKGSILFGLQEAREAIRNAGNVLVVEGYFDVITLSEAGIGWSVGTCGTALTPEQAGLLRRYTEKWTLLFDGDPAGRAAVLRALDVAVPVHPAVQVALCPDGTDPDAWVRRDGAERLREALAQAASPLQYLEDWGRGEGWSPEATIPRVAGLLRKVTDPMVRDLWVQEAARRFRIGERTIWQAIGPLPSPRAGQPPTGSAPVRSGLTARERQILATAVQHPHLSRSLREACDEVPGISGRCLEILAWIADRKEEGISSAPALLSRMSEEGPEMTRDLSFLHGEAGPIEEVPPDLLRRLRASGLRRRMRDLTDQIRRAEERGEEIQSLLAEKQRLAVELRDLDAIEEMRGRKFS